MDRARASGKNRCVFCFVDQLPRGMRKTLYFKDDDARLSFDWQLYYAYESFEREITRIIDLRISPINVSVHATDPALRAKLLGNPEAAGGYELLKKACCRRHNELSNCLLSDLTTATLFRKA